MVSLGFSSKLLYGSPPANKPDLANSLYDGCMDNRGPSRNLSHTHRRHRARASSLAVLRAPLRAMGVIRKDCAPAETSCRCKVKPNPQHSLTPKAWSRPSGPPAPGGAGRTFEHQFGGTDHRLWQRLARRCFPCGRPNRCDALFRSWALVSYLRLWMIPCFNGGPFTFRLGLAHARPPAF